MVCCEIWIQVCAFSRVGLYWLFYVYQDWSEKEGPNFMVPQVFYELDMVNDMEHITLEAQVVLFEGFWTKSSQRDKTLIWRPSFAALLISFQIRLETCSFPGNVKLGEMMTGKQTHTNTQTKR